MASSLYFDKSTSMKNNIFRLISALIIFTAKPVSMLYIAFEEQLFPSYLNAKESIDTLYERKF